MGIFQQFPYTNFHEMNLDQIIKIMREMQDEWADTKAEWASYKDFIDNYFATLDVSEEVLHALQAMAASGELNQIIDPVIASETADWLATHITPTTPIVDASLTISGAAADAAVAGEKIALLTSIAELSDRTLQESDMIQGSYNPDGSVMPVSTKIRNNGFINVAKGDKLTIYPGTRCNGSIIGIFDTAGVFVREIGWNTAIAGETFTSDQKIIIAFRDNNNPNQVLAPENYDALVLINSGLQEKIDFYDSINMEMEDGSISSTGNTTNSGNFYINKHNKYPIDLNNATYLLFQSGLTLPVGADYITVYFYAQDLSYVGYKEIHYNQQRAIMVPANSKYARVMISRLTLDHCRIYSDTELKEVKNLKLNSEYEKFLFKVSENDFSAGSLMLAYNYAPEGVKTPLIIYMHGSGYYTTLASGFPINAQNNIKYLTDEGYNVLDIHAWGNAMLQRYPDCGQAYPYVTPTCIDILTKGIKYALDHFNIDPDRIHIMCKSQGGQVALYMASNPFIPIKSIGMFAPVLDYLSMPGEYTYVDARKAIALDMGLVNTSYYTSLSYNTFTPEAAAFWNENKNALAGLNEAFFKLINGTIDDKINSSLTNGKSFWDDQLWNDPDGGDIYTDTDYVKLAEVPVKIWGASDDDQTPYRKMVEVVQQLLNGGVEAVLETMPRGTGGHGAADLGSNTTNITAASGTTYTNIPVGWVENIEWIKLHEQK